MSKREIYRNIVAVALFIGFLLAGAEPQQEQFSIANYWMNGVGLIVSAFAVLWFNRDYNQNKQDYEK